MKRARTTELSRTSTVVVGGTQATTATAATSISKAKTARKSKVKYTEAQRKKMDRALLMRLRKGVDLNPHFYDYESGSPSVTGDGYITNLNNGSLITQGDGVQQRTGDSIYCKNLSFRYVIGVSSQYFPDSVWKVYIILQKNPDGAGIPAITNIFEAADGTYHDSTVIVPRLWETMRDYKILASNTHVVKQLTLGTDGAGSYLGQTAGEGKEYGEFSIPLNFTSKYESTAGLCEDNQLLLVVKNSSDTSIGGVAAGYVRFYSRLTFAP